MLQGNIKLGKRAFYPEALNKVIDFLTNENLEELDCGQYDIDGDNIFVIITELQTKDRTEKQPEIHHKNIDVHCVIKGEEKDFFFPDNEKMEIAADWENDVRLYRNNPEIQEGCCVLKPGDFVVFFPEDAHITACNVKAAMPIKKAIAKIAVDAFEPASSSKS